MWECCSKGNRLRYCECHIQRKEWERYTWCGVRKLKQSEYGHRTTVTVPHLMGRTVLLYGVHIMTYLSLCTVDSALWCWELKSCRTKNLLESNTCSFLWRQQPLVMEMMDRDIDEELWWDEMTTCEMMPAGPYALTFNLYGDDVASTVHHVVWAHVWTSTRWPPEFWPPPPNIQISTLPT